MRHKQNEVVNRVPSNSVWNDNVCIYIFAFWRVSSYWICYAMFRQQKILRLLSVSYQFGGISADPEAKSIELLYDLSYFYLFVCLFICLF